MLSNEQIQHLFTFCKKHHVHFYDVQTELVDHLANAIEEKMRANPAIPFEKALENVHAGFGVLGFAGLVKSRSESLHKQYNKLRWQLFWSYFAWPKAALTACLLSGFIFLGRLLSQEILFYIMCILFLSLYVFDIYVVVKAGSTIKKQKQKLMITQISFERSFLLFCAGGILSGMVHMEDLFEKVPVVSYAGYVIFIILSVLFLFSTITYGQVMKAVQEMARMQYPEAFQLAK